MKVLYCDCFSGISGDMFLAAVIDSGFSVDLLTTELLKLRLPAFESIEIRDVQKGALRAKHMQFRLSTRDQSHRHLPEIKEIILKSEISETAKRTSIEIFTNLARAEAHVHGIDMDAVHFHEVGGDDAILDIVGAAVVLDLMNIEKLYSSPLPLGSGKVKTQHGLLPVPAPATLELIRACGGRTMMAPGDGELVTPTGAALISTLGIFSEPAMKVTSVGVGAGTRDFLWPNIMRVVLGDTTVEDGLVLLETNIDDMNPEIYGYLFERLFAVNALDVFLTPIIMKKNRPAIKLSVLTQRQNEPLIAEIIFKETTTLGIRKVPVTRYETSREKSTIQTEWGEVAVKIKMINSDEIIQVTPEYEDCVRLARETGKPMLDIYQQALILANEKFLLRKPD